MSIWTQVDGKIKLKNLKREEIIKRLGTPFDYTYIKEFGFPKDNPIPCGADGSLKYKISEDCTEIVIYGNIRTAIAYEKILNWVLLLSEIDPEDDFDKNISYADIELSIGEPPHKYIYQGFLTNGQYWDEYRIIPQSDYEKFSKS